MINLTGLWLKTSKKGVQYLGGKIDVTDEIKNAILNNQEVYLNVFKATPKPGAQPNPKAPMYNAVLSEPQEQTKPKPKANNDFFGSNPNPTTARGPLAQSWNQGPPIQDEDIPF